MSSEASPTTKEELESVLTTAISILQDEPLLVEYTAHTVLFVGDLHGDLGALEDILSYIEIKDVDKVVFLGDYVDRGPEQIEVITSVLNLKISEPDRYILLRGNHETPEINSTHGFKEQVLERFDDTIYDLYSSVFQQMPVAALHSTYRILALHGGIPKGLDNISQINWAKKENKLTNQMIIELLWNDPINANTTFAASFRSPKLHTFGKKAFEKFMNTNNLSYLVRAHEFVEEGYYKMWGGRLITVFSTEYRKEVKRKILLCDERKKMKIVSF